MSPPAPAYIERRAEPRVPAKLPARAYFGDSLNLWADCELRDLSQSGAKIHVASVYKLPPRFMLLHLQDGSAFEVILKWRRGDLAGVSFEHRHELKDLQEPRLTPLREAWLALLPGFSGG